MGESDGMSKFVGYYLALISRKSVHLLPLTVGCVNEDFRHIHLKIAIASV